MVVVIVISYHKNVQNCLIGIFIFKMTLYEAIESLVVVTFHSNMLLTLWADLQTSVSAWLIGESD